MPDAPRISRLAIPILAGLWLVLFVGSFVAAWLAEPTGDGFTRGLNRVEDFFGWQFWGFVAALVCAIVTKYDGQQLGRRLRQVGYAPLVIDLVLIGLLVLLVFWMRAQG